MYKCFQIKQNIEGKSPGSDSDDYLVLQLYSEYSVLGVDRDDLR